MEIPIGWVLASFGVLCGTITSLAGMIYAALKGRIDSQNRVIDRQADSIRLLQADVQRLAIGCGADGCHWTTGRGPIITPVKPISPSCAVADTKGAE